MRLLAVLFLYVSMCAQAQRFHSQAHAHNDYEHQRPLFDALAHGFTSVEADVHLMDGELHVSHQRPAPSARRTLRALYLAPLDSLCRRGEFTPLERPFILMVDIKTEATRTVEKLIAELDAYPSLTSPGSPVRVVISGNRDYALIRKATGLAIDGRPADLDKGFSAQEMPLVSDHFGNVMRWNGKGDPNSSEVEKVRALARRVHAEGKLLRLWAIPDREEAWDLLLDVGVDLINTDRLEALNEFLRRRD